MNNLIMNSKWAPGCDGGPSYFSAKGTITYDDLCINGYRTCSLTMTPCTDSPMLAVCYYDQKINVTGMNNITFGYCMRCIDHQCIKLCCDFYDCNRNLADSKEYQIDNQICCDFRTVAAQFCVPCSAEFCCLSIKFVGKITACTFYAPFCYCNC